MAVPFAVPPEATSTHLPLGLTSAPPVKVHFCALVPLQVHICSRAPSTKLELGTSTHLLLSELITETAPVGVVPPPPPENGDRMIPAERGSPSLTSDSKLPTSSKANAYALPSVMFAWIVFAYTLVGLFW